MGRLCFDTTLNGTLGICSDEKGEITREKWLREFVRENVYITLLIFALCQLCVKSNVGNVFGWKKKGVARKKWLYEFITIIIYVCVLISYNVLNKRVSYNCL